MPNRKTKSLAEMVSLANALHPYFSGQKQLSADAIPEGISPQVTAALRVMALIVETQTRLAGEVHGAIERDDGPSIDRSGVMLVAFNDFIDAVIKGKQHPIFDYWLTVRGKPQKEFVAGLPTGQTRARRSSGRIFSREAAVAVEALILSGLSVADSEARISSIFNQTTIFQKCSRDIIHNWRTEAIAESSKEVKSAARELSAHYQSDPDKVAAAFKAELKKYQPIIGDG